MNTRRDLLNTGDPARLDWSTASNRELGKALMSWGGSDKDGIFTYAVGSHIFSEGRPADAYVRTAIKELTNLRARANYPETITPGDEAECNALARELERRFPSEGE